MLTRFARWPSGKFTVDRKAPKGVGRERDGYAFDRFTGDQAVAIELVFIKPKDHRVNRMLRRPETDGTSGRGSNAERHDRTFPDDRTGLRRLAPGRGIAGDSPGSPQAAPFRRLVLDHSVRRLCCGSWHRPLVKHGAARSTQARYK